MAKGNDGNLFQHTIEVEAAAFLLRESAGLHFVTTHAMAPMEPFDPPSPGSEKTSSLIR